jgi:AraC-like DNA-binding protein
MPRASDVQYAERLNRARILLDQVHPLSHAAERLRQEYSLSPRQAYRYLEQAQDLTEPASPGEAKLAFTVKLPHSLIRRVRAWARTRGVSISEVVSQALLVQLPQDGRTAPGPEKKPIALDVVGSLASLGCTVAEIATVVGVSERTLMRRQKDEKFREALESGRGRGRAALRRMQWKAPTKGNARMQIWLGRQLLGQRDENERGYRGENLPLTPDLVPSIVYEWISPEGTEDAGVGPVVSPITPG